MKINAVLLICIVLLSISTCFRIFWNLDASPLERWDEETNKQVVQQTILHKTFPILVLNNTPFFEKPPLWYSVQIGISKILGVSVFNLRLVSAISGITIIFVTVFFSWKLWGNISSIVTWIILLTSHQLYVNNPENIFATHTFRSADLDALFILFLVLSFICGTVNSHSKKWQIMSGIFAGLSFLVKGPLGLLPFVVGIAVYRKNKQKTITYVCSLIISFCVITPWYLWMFLTFGYKFFDVHFIYHLQMRVLSPIEGHNNSFTYFGLLLTNPKIFPWGIPLIISILWGFFYTKNFADKNFLIIFILVILFFAIPTVMQTRLSWYILPIYPFAALLLGNIASKFYREFLSYR